MKNENEFGYTLERFLDDYMGNLSKGGSVRKPNFESAIKLYKPSKREIKILKEHFQEVRTEVCCAINKTDMDLVEGYSFLSTTKLKKLDEYLEDLIETLESKSKITRRKKKIDPNKLVNGVQYMPVCKEFNLESVDPVTIVGAKGLLCFNTKTKKLILFEAEGVAGLTVKGTTVKGFSKSSNSKTLRKNNFNVLNNITEGAVPTGRINKDTVILRAYLQ